MSRRWEGGWKGAERSAKRGPGEGGPIVYSPTARKMKRKKTNNEQKGPVS
jgi:hypothetical protein